MALTLVEAAKLNTGDSFRNTIIEMYAQSSDILMTLPFQDIPGNSHSYNQEQTLPGVGFRGVNEGFAESTGVLNPQTERLVIAGGDLDVDRFIVQTMGQQQRAVQEQMQIKAIGLAWTRTFVKGDSTVEPREFDGVQRRVSGNQLIVAGTTSGGDVLSLGKLDELIDAVDSPTALIMNKTMRRRLTAAARDTTVGGFVTFEQDAFGRRQTMYNDLPILIADDDETNTQILPFSEPAPTGGQLQTTSIYCVSFMDGMFTGLQNGLIDPRDLGELDSKPVFRTRVEWYNGIAVFHGRSVARLHGITDAAVTK